jgi:hypothetical protein
MAKSPTKPFRMAPLQRLTVKPIQDAAEQAALDEQIKRYEEAMTVVPTPTRGADGVTQVRKPLPSTPSRPSTRKRRR